MEYRTHSLTPRLTRGFVGGILVFLIGMSGIAVPGERDMSYANDPLGLVSHFDLTSWARESSGVYEVWACERAGGNSPVSGATADDLVNEMRPLIAEYWLQESGGAFEISLMVGGDVEVNGTESDCFQAVAGQSKGDADAVLILRKNSYSRRWAGGVGTPGSYCYTETSFLWCSPGFPKNDRYAMVDLGVDGEKLPLDSIVHEIGHTLTFPHSYTGTLSRGHPNYEYDNLMDVMSGGGYPHNMVGTIAPNRYAAGWIPDDRVHVHSGGVSRVTLSTNWRSGTQMVALPSGEQGLWLSLGARESGRFDWVPKDGVEAYLIDQRPGRCGTSTTGQDTCWGIARVTTAYPSNRGGELAHVIDVGDSLEWDGVTVVVIDRAPNGFVVEITDGESRSGVVIPPDSSVGGSGYAGYFADDDGNAHEMDIDLVAEMGITKGCAAGDAPKFCPDEPVTRAQMAAFLVRSMEVPPSEVQPAHLKDVLPEAWYADFVHAVVALGIDVGEGGLWRPDDPLTRLEMARWLTAAMIDVRPVVNPEGLFEDVAPADRSVVEGLYASGITEGCSADPLLFCPDQPVTRAQMSSFLIRSIL